MIEHEILRDFASEDSLIIKDIYDHRNSPWDYEISKKYPSVYIMFTKNFELAWSPSGNELRRIYLENPDGFISEPIHVPIPKYLKKEIDDAMDNW